MALLPKKIILFDQDWGLPGAGMAQRRKELGYQAIYRRTVSSPSPGNTARVYRPHWTHLALDEHNFYPSRVPPAGLQEVEGGGESIYPTWLLSHPVPVPFHLSEQTGLEAYQLGKI